MMLGSGPQGFEWKIIVFPKPSTRNVLSLSEDLSFSLPGPKLGFYLPARIPFVTWGRILSLPVLGRFIKYPWGPWGSHGVPMDSQGSHGDPMGGVPSGKFPKQKKGLRVLMGGGPSFFFEAYLPPPTPSPWGLSAEEPT